MKQLVFASSNQNKVKEIRQRLPKGYEVVSMRDLNITDDIPETADTFEGNALLKAQYLFANYQLDCFADDSGLVIHALNGDPGVYSARYAGPQRSDNDNMNKVLEALKGIEERTAAFKTVIVLCLNGEYHSFEGSVEGAIIHEKKGEHGFGYDPIFVPNGSTRTFAEMTMEEKNGFSHRSRALDKMMSFLSKNK